MKKQWLLSPLLALILTCPLLGNEIEASFFDGSEMPHALLTGNSHEIKRTGNRSDGTTGAQPEIKYRLPADFWGIDTFAEYLLWQVQEQASYFVANHTPSTFDNQVPATAQKNLRKSMHSHRQNQIR